MTCPTCGAQLNEGLKFCTQCGTPLQVAEAPVAEAPVVETPAYEAPAYEAPAQAAPAYEAPAYEAAPVYEAPAQAAPVYEAPAATDPGAGLGKTSKILGIIGIVTSCCGFGSILAIVALILGIVGGKKSKGAGFENASAKTGLILGIVGIVISAIIYIAYLIYYVVVLGAMSTMYY